MGYFSVNGVNQVISEGWTSEALDGEVIRELMAQQRRKNHCNPLHFPQWSTSVLALDWGREET